MKEIQIAPSRENTRIVDNTIEGFIENEDGTRDYYRFTADDKDLRFPKEHEDAWKDYFSAAIFMASYGADVEWAFARRYVKGKMSTWTEKKN